MVDGPRRPRLSDALAAGRAQARRLQAGVPVTEQIPTNRLAEARAELEEGERVGASPAPLWRREWAVTVARAAERTAGAVGEEDMRARAVRLQDMLHEQDEAEIGPVREALAAGGFEAEAFRAAVAARVPHERDPFVRRLLKVDRVPERVTERPAGMVHYVASPLDATLEICRFVGPEDLFCDVGSGLGLVTMLVRLLTGARTRGVEYDPAYHAWAEARAAELGIDRIEYVQGDARFADYSGVTVVYFYDTFRGGFLEEMVVRMKEIADAGPLTVISRGMSSPVLEAVPWLEVVARPPSELVVLRPR